MVVDKLKKTVRDIPDFPRKGIVFKDIVPVLADTELCLEITREIAGQYSSEKPDAIIGIESRGFFFGMMIARELKIPFIPVRKKGKLPYDTISHSYDLEYGKSEVEIHTDSIKKGDCVLIHDDLLATGGTADAAAQLVEKSGGKVCGFSFLIELSFLKGREKLEKISENISSLACY